MWIVKLSIFIVLIGLIYCEKDDVAKVMEIKNVTQIKSGNYVSSQMNNTQRRISTYDTRMIGQCGGIFRNIQNLIESPKFISAHPICNLRCEYQIISPYVCENEFHVQFLDFSIDSSSEECVRDRVVINYSDELCGKIVGVKKYRTTGGVLNITFSSSSWDSTEKGFRLLVTRLPCVDDEIVENQDAVETTTEAAPDDCYHVVNSSYSVQNPTYENQHPIYGVPYGFNNLSNVELNNRQDIPVIPLPPPIFPPTINPPPPQTTDYPPPPIFPPQIPLPQCCRNVYTQQRFLMFSQGFPAYSVLNNDCVYVIHKSSVNACRLRIHFKYFLLDDIPQQPGQQLGCFNNYVEIDGQRICGCKTNFVYETQWGLEPKIIRLHTSPGTYYNAQGFLLDIEQHDCPFKLREKRTILTKKLLLNHFLQHHRHHPQQQQPLAPPPPLPFFPHQNIDVDDTFRAKFFNNNGDSGISNNGYVNSQCTINHLQLLQLKFDSFGIYKHFCLPSY